MTTITAVPGPDPEVVAAMVARICEAFARLVDVIRRVAAVIVWTLRDAVARWWPTLTRLAAAHRAEQQRIHVSYRHRQLARRRKGRRRG